MGALTPNVLTPQDLEPNWKWEARIPAWGHTSVDFERRIDHDRLRRYRLSRTRQALKNSNAGTLLLFDVNNVYVSSYNHGFSTNEFLHGVPRNRIVQFHVAGHSHEDGHIVDTHDHPVCDEVWDFYREAVTYFGPVSTMIERDDNIPPLAEVGTDIRFGTPSLRPTGPLRLEGDFDPRVSVVSLVPGPASRTAWS